jgi:hypothetical protein
MSTIKLCAKLLNKKAGKDRDIEYGNIKKGT